MAQNIDSNLEEKIGLIKQVYTHLKEEFETINSVQLKLLSENEDTQREIINHYKFQVYLSGTKKKFIKINSFFKKKDFIKYGGC